MRTRYELHDILCEDLGNDQCYFSPPSNIRMWYPCIVYNYDGMLTRYADDKRYLNHKRYSLTIIDEDPDSLIPKRLFSDCRLTYLSEDTIFVADGLYHFAYTLYF